MNYYQYDIDHASKKLQTSATNGLEEAIIALRLNENGFNEISKKEQNNYLRIFIKQFKNLLVILLIIAATFSLYLGSYRDGIVLFSIVFGNALLGFYQDLKSGNIINSITDLIVERCIVIRNGIKKEIPVSLIVTGDLIILNEGDGIPADIRLTSCSNFAVNEFILTGESQPRKKNANVIFVKEIGISERDNCIYMGTTVARGHATGLVYATGMQTELGKIAEHSNKITQETSPLQKEINKLSYKITYTTFILATILFALKIATNDSINQSLIFAIGVAAAMVPEGLPAQISIALSMGVRKLAKRKAIVKHLSSVEALGAATVIATDKTGTITKNEMTITMCHLDRKTYKITGIGFTPEGEIQELDSRKKSATENPDKNLLFAFGHLASTSDINPPDEFHPDWYPLGDPTESAFTTLAFKAGFNPTELNSQFETVQINTFDSERKRMSIIRKYNSKYRIFVKGSIESLLEISNYFSDHEKIRPLTEEDKNTFLTLAKAFAANGLRIIAIGYKDTAPEEKTYSIPESEADLIFVGFVCMIDPPHESVKETIKAALDAHIRIMMITGDNEITAAAIADQIGLKNPDGTAACIYNEAYLQTISDTDLVKLLEKKTIIFSRVSPEEKLRIVELLKQRGDTVAVTGDGVNDTLSLKRSDIGVAMGKNGSRIAREAASMVLLDDNFSTIVHAIKEGRTIYKNIQKNVIATLSTNLAEVCCVLVGFAGLFLNFPPVIMAIHILLIDLIGEMLPLLALSIDPSEDSIMTEPPRKAGNLIEKTVLANIISSGLVRGAIAIWSFFQVYTNADNYELAITTTFVSIIFSQFVSIFSLRTKGSVFSLYSLNNKYLFAGIGLSMLITGAVLYIPFLNTFLHTAPLTWNELQYPITGAILYLFLTETIKLFKRSNLSKR